ncbi:thioredoxin-disulfide reductase [Desulfomonile tiedjei]|uniref:Thioredoxin reductase n=1 Tax=Desulfomonile tiedjei (strain ATCC 49306 / DSM 6799 / DCB-1) TaxID=706587 RepID=I4C482_DESTA|nr:thioredoxin-disulfide reductase [Desulfomonile tiedjei DSM 6799]
MPMTTELIILGGGPAGLTAGIYSTRARISTMLLEKGIPGGQMTATEYVDNYPGFPEPILGMDLSKKMEAQAVKFGLDIRYGDVKSVLQVDDGFSIITDSDETFHCRAVIAATGASPMKLGIPGELELAGRGVSYCAVCDGPFFRETELAVVGGGDSAVEEAVYLTRFASKVHLIHRRDQLRACHEIQEKAFSEPKILVHWNTIPVEILGNKEVTGIRLRSASDQTESVLPISGVFFYVGLNPNSSAYANLVETDQRGFIVTDERMVTSVPGFFAAGDVRSKILRQISTAIGDGAIAAYSAQHYLEHGASSLRRTSNRAS